MIDWTKPVRDKKTLEVLRVICIDRKFDRHTGVAPVVMLNKAGHIRWSHLNGCFHNEVYENIPPEPITRTYYVNEFGKNILDSGSNELFVLGNRYKTNLFPYRVTVTLQP